MQLPRQLAFLSEIRKHREPSLQRSAIGRLDSLATSLILCFAVNLTLQTVEVLRFNPHGYE